MTANSKLNMRYLIIDSGEVFYTDWFVIENHYKDGMIIIDLFTHQYMCEKNIWIEIPEDCL